MLFKIAFLFVFFIKKINFSFVFITMKKNDKRSFFSVYTIFASIKSFFNRISFCYYCFS